MKQPNVTSFFRDPSKASARIDKGAKLPTRSAVKSDNSTHTQEQILASIKSSSFKNRWQIHGTHLIRNVPEKIHKRYSEGDDKGVKVAAFDLDGTIVSTKSGSRFPKSSNDWKWIDGKEGNETSVISKVIELISSEHLIVIFTNQGGVLPEKMSKSYINFTGRLNLIVAELYKHAPDIEQHLLVFASPKRPSSKKLRYTPSSEKEHSSMRKPNTGMWTEMLKYLSSQKQSKIDRASSFFVGDAAGNPGDFSDSDKAFAANIQIGKFLLPQNIFQ